MAIGKQIKYHRDRLGWTLLQLSDASNVDVGTISALEIRDSSRSKFFPAIAKALGLSVEQLANEDPQKTNQYPAGNDSALVTKLVFHERRHSPQTTTQADPWITEAVQILSQLNESEKAACVVQLRAYKAAIGPPQNGQTLSMAVKKRRPRENNTKTQPREKLASRFESL